MILHKFYVIFSVEIFFFKVVVTFIHVKAYTEIKIYKN